MTMTEPQMAPTPTLEVDEEGVAWVTFDDPQRSANILSEGVLRRLMDCVEQLQEGIEGGRVRAAVFRSVNPRIFIAGADVEAIADIQSPLEGAEASRLGQAIFLEVEQLPIPTVAAIRGACLGGGLELALACRYRVAADDEETRLGLPEVQLGILPAWGGTTRLSRLIGLQAALDILLTGKRVSSRKAHETGLVDALLPSATLDEAVRDFTLERVEKGPIRTGGRRGFFKKLLEESPPGRRVILRAARKRVLSRSGGHYPAPLKILDVLRDGLGRSVERSLELEATAAGELLVSPVTKSLVHVFRLREGARKGRGLNPEVQGREVKRMGVVGAGVMGGGIAQLAAYHGVAVRIKDLEHEPVAQALDHARSLFDKAVGRGRLSEGEAQRGMDRISGGVDYSGFGGLDLVVEAVVERLEVKRSVFSELEERTAGHAALATNTSTLRVDEMAEGLEAPERLVGMHFFNPVHRMPLVEVVRGPRTSDEAAATVHRFAVALGKVPVVVGDGPGFVVNRILGPYLNEAGHLLAEGAAVETVDQAAVDFGLPMGPLRLVDEVGIDVVGHAGRVLHEAFGSRLEPAPPLAALGESGRLGVKGGSGFYRYKKGKEAGVDPAIYQVLGSSVPRTRRNPSRDEVQRRLVLTMINEAARVLEENVAPSAADVDLAMIMGTGFPPFRGGLLRYADSLHPRRVLKELEEFRAQWGERFEPSAPVVRLAQGDKGFYEAYPAP